MSTHKPRMTNYNHNYHHPHIIIKNQAGSDINNHNNNNMQDLLNSHEGKLDPCRCTLSAESSTCSHLKLERNNNYINNNNSSCKKTRINRINFKLKKAAEAKNISENISIDDNKNNDMNKKSSKMIKDANDYIKKYNALLEKMVEGGEDHHVVRQVVAHQVCSMCGDVGVAELLFLCTKCSHRHQHIYCGRSYPNMGGEASMCNWCLHEEDSLISSTAKVSEVNKTTARPYTNQTKELYHPAGHVNQASSLIKELNQVTGDDEDDAERMVMVKRGHSKAFEYLLLVAAQSLPPDNQVISEVNPELKQANKYTASMINITNQVISEASPELKQAASHTASMFNITNQVISDTSPELKQEAKHTASMINFTNPKMGVNINLGNRLSMGLEKKVNLNKQNIDLHSKLNRRLDDEQKIDVGGLIGGNVPKRQRCSKGINTSLKGINPSLKCRKKGFQLSPSRPNYRRYKLLADVVC